MEAARDRTVAMRYSMYRVAARRQMLNYRMGMGHDSYRREYQGVMSSSRYSDNNQLRFYERWSELMAAGSPVS